ncbi:hypothetical protein OAO87_01205, partial [bacterium]|nr:hypothetical protein [bacterium]
MNIIRDCTPRTIVLFVDTWQRFFLTNFDGANQDLIRATLVGSGPASLVDNALQFIPVELRISKVSAI